MIPDALFFQNVVVDWRAFKHERETRTIRTLKRKKLHTHLSIIHVLVLPNPRFII